MPTKTVSILIGHDGMTQRVEGRLSDTEPDFWGADHIVFGADMPLGDHYYGLRSYRQTINAIEAMDITAAEKKKIFAENAVSLLRLPV